MKSTLSLFTFLLFFSNTFGQSPVVEVWKQTIKVSLNSINKSNSLCIDKQGNCYVLGTTWFADSTKDILLIKYNEEGEEEWQRVYDNPSHGDDIPSAMCLDKEGNIWICGTAKTKSNNVDFLVVKFTPDGIPVSDEIYDGKNHLYDVATCIAADRQGNVYAAGYETSIDSGINMLVLKCKSDGSITWNRGYTSRQMDVASKIITDDSSNVYVCGTANSGLHSADIIIQKYDSEGRKKWQIIYDGVLAQNDAGQYMAADDSMNIYVSGFINHSSDRADIPLLKINRNGQIIQEGFYYGRIADCGAANLNVNRSFINLTGGCNDYNISSINSFLVRYDKGGNQKYVLNAPDDVQLLSSAEINDQPMVFGAMTTHPESTLIPFIAEGDSSGFSWTFADSTVYGLAHMRYIEVKDSNVYFLGDDTGDATGTISVFKYALNPEAEKRKRPVKKIK